LEIIQGRIAKTDTFNKPKGVNMKNQPAFPCQYEEHLPTWNGMTLRDYFAAKAMQGFLTNDNLLKASCEWHQDGSEISIAQLAYDQADAMLKARGE
jgi:hypothetical protein